MVCTWSCKWIWISYLYYQEVLGQCSYSHMKSHTSYSTSRSINSNLDLFVPHLYYRLRLISSSFDHHCVIFDKSGSRQAFCVWSFKYNHRRLKDFGQQTLWPLNFMYSECCTFWISCSSGLRQCPPCYIRSGIPHFALCSFLWGA